MAGSRAIIGWREWVALPDLGIPALKAKIDTGAKTSTLHAFDVETETEGGVLFVSFGVHPLRTRRDVVVRCRAEVFDQRNVRDSGGHTEQRLVIVSRVELGARSWPIELTLTNRDTMLFPMLLGRRAMQDRFIVDPDQSYTTGRGYSRLYRHRRSN
jgi:hypothetical protein